MRPKTLSDFFGEYKSSGSQRNYRNCPVCLSSGWKTYVDPDTGKWICFAGSCGARGRVSVDMSVGRLRGLLTRGRGVPEFPVVDIPTFQPLTERHRKQLRLRYEGLGMPEKYLIVSMAEETGEDRVVLPYVRKDRSVIYWSTRHMSGGVPKYRGMGGKHPLYIPAYLQPFDSERIEVVLVEGVFDAISVRERLSKDAVALGGKYLPDHLVPYLREYVGDRSIIILLDADALGDALKLKNRLSGLMPKTPVRVALCRGKDPACTSTLDLKEVLR